MKLEHLLACQGRQSPSNDMSNLHGAGVAVYSRRAVPLAAWTSGLEVANVAADSDRACLVLETGVNQRWRYGNYQRTPENTADARAWEAAKTAARCTAAACCTFTQDGTLH